jgi:ubiquinol-cytochrome c reductase cytochrome c1 subunit
MRKTTSLLAALAATISLGLAAPALAAGDAAHPKEYEWGHTGPFGTFDRAAAQRGLLVYQQVCASCHGLRLVALRTLQDIGLSEGTVKALAAQYTITDGPNDDGDMFDRPGKPSDRFPNPFANMKAAAAANGGAAPPDLSLMVKARKGHEDYLASLLTGYTEPPANHEVPEGAYYNPYFPGGNIKMPPPLNPDQVEYPDGTKATVEQMAHDVTVFLAWAAEPTMEQRKRTGVKVIIFLLILTGVLYAAKRKIWADVH